MEEEELSKDKHGVFEVDSLYLYFGESAFEVAGSPKGFQFKGEVLLGGDRRIIIGGCWQLIIMR